MGSTVSLRVYKVLRGFRWSLGLSLLFCYLLLGGIIGCCVASVNLMSTAHALFTTTRSFSPSISDMPFVLSLNWAMGYFISIIMTVIQSFYPFLIGSRETLDPLKIVGLNIQYSAYFGFSFSC